VPVAVFCIFFVFQKIHMKSSPNGTKLFNDFSRRKETPEASWEGQKSHEEGTTHHGAPEGPGLPRWVVLTSRPIFA
jgi:hypothetical protein